MQPVRPLLLLALGPWLATAAAAQTAALSNRVTNVFGNFTVGAGSLVDSGSFSEFLTAPLSASYGRNAADAGAVSGSFNGQPVEGSASFASAAAYTFGDGRAVGSGSAATTGDTPFAHVSLGANAQGTVRLDFTLPVLTRAVLKGSVTSLLGPDVGSRTSAAQASVSLNGVGSWATSSHQGSFQAVDMLFPGLYSLRATSSSRLNGAAQFSFDLLLTPVPEPGSAALLAAGLAGVGLWRRRGAGRDAAVRRG